MARPRPGARLLGALAALCVALSLAPAANAACPTNCSNPLSYNTITAPAGVPVNSGNSLSSCRRTCNFNSFPYYSFSSAGGNAWSCTCFAGCTATGKVPTGSGPVFLGYGPACADINCPVECAGPLGGLLITSPSASRVTSGKKSTKDCATFCQGKGLFYTFSSFSEGACSCYSTCNSTNTLTITPQYVGYIPACVGLPKVVPSRCSALLSACPPKKCPGMSVCTNKQVGEKTKFQCCCNPPNVPSVVNGTLKACAPPPQ